MVHRDMVVCDGDALCSPTRVNAVYIELRNNDGYNSCVAPLFEQKRRKRRRAQLREGKKGDFRDCVHTLSKKLGITLE